jgi:hypothetical protein
LILRLKIRSACSTLPFRTLTFIHHPLYLYKSIERAEKKLLSILLMSLYKPISSLT